jgi:Di-haem oxidoreductase, putative peroxidase
MWKQLAALAGVLAAGLVAIALLAAPAWAQDPLPSDPEVDDGPAHTATATLTLSEATATDAKEADAKVYLKQKRQQGLSVFSTPFNTYDGLGDGPFVGEEPPLAFGHRPTLQGNDLSLRVNGLDSQSCNECHTIVSHATRPPTLGLAGVGGIVQNAIIMPSLIDVADTFDDRVHYMTGHQPDLQMLFDGVADYNGRYANPPFLFGGGGVEALAKEMTRDLQGLLDWVQGQNPGVSVSLDTHGTHFGSATKTYLKYPLDVEFDLQGIGVENYQEKLEKGEILPEQLLVVRPFGRKGENFSMRDFDRGAMQFHFGIQPVEVPGIGHLDEDQDLIIDEVTEAEMTVLHIFDVTNPVPVQAARDPSAEHGFEVFKDIGCKNCHRPEMTTYYRTLPLAFPEVAENPDAYVYRTISLTKVGFAPVVHGGVTVPLFADLKRHKMGGNGGGDGLKEDFDDERRELFNDEFTTARLWGIADTAPYLHDGRATTLFQAILLHGGEAQPVRNAFVNLPPLSQTDLLNFLKTLHAPDHPDAELLPLP